MENPRDCPEPKDDLTFVTMATTERDLRNVELMVRSIRSNGGSLSDCPVWLFTDSSHRPSAEMAMRLNVEAIPMDLPDHIEGYILGDKVFACAQAEDLAGSHIRSLVWLSPDTLMVRPPLLFDLDESVDAALRPVHVRNVGILADDPIDDFWRGVMDCAGLSDMDLTVESFVDGQTILAYFNSHSICVNPTVGLLRNWLVCFEKLVEDIGFQEGFCSDDLHKIFLHQAALSAVAVSKVPEQRIRILPPSYSYPYNLQSSVPSSRRAAVMNELTTVVFEERSMDPARINDIEVREPLRSWLSRATSKTNTS